MKEKGNAWENFWWKNRVNLRNIKMKIEHIKFAQKRINMRTQWNL